MKNKMILSGCIFITSIITMALYSIIQPPINTIIPFIFSLILWVIGLGIIVYVIAQWYHKNWTERFEQELEKQRASEVSE